MLWLLDDDNLHGLDEVAEYLGIKVSPGIAVDMSAQQYGADAKLLSIVSMVIMRLRVISNYVHYSQKRMKWMLKHRMTLVGKSVVWSMLHQTVG